MVRLLMYIMSWTGFDLIQNYYLVWFRIVCEPYPAEWKLIELS